MKKLILCGLLLILATSGLAQATVYEVTGDRRINVRTEPSTTASVLTQLAPGDQVEVTGEVDGDAVSGSTLWYALNISGVTGYVHNSLLRPAQTAESAEVAGAVDRPAVAVEPTRGVPANPNADSRTRAVLRYLNGLTDRTDNRVLSGQFGAYGDGTSAETATEQLERIFADSGQYPALTGMDYQRWDMQHANDFSEPNGFLIDAWNAGSLVNISWHASNPWTGGHSTDWEDTRTEDPWDTYPVGELLETGSPVARQWRAMLANIADGLQELEDAGVVVIWRPLHEMNGGWAWWHLQEPDEFIALWRDMFDYFTYDRGLDNLLWAYTPMMKGHPDGPSPIVFYPGAAYVDLVGLDKYMELDEDPLDLNGYGEYDGILTLDKPIGLFEFGPLPASGEGWDTFTYDYANLIRDIRDLYPEVVLFQAWEYVWQIGRHANAAGLMRDPWVITRGELPSF